MLNSLTTSARLWQNGEKDDGSIHCLGNGRLCVYEQGPNIIQLFGPPYHAPTAMQCRIISDEIRSISRRVTGTAIWQHELFRKDELAGTFIDFVDSEIQCFVRTYSLQSPVSISIKFAAGASSKRNSDRFKNGRCEGLLAVLPAGQVIYALGNYKCVTTENKYYQVLVHGKVSVSAQKESEFDFILEAGKGELYVVGGPEYPECVECTEKILSVPVEQLLHRTQAHWDKFRLCRKDLEEQIVVSGNGKEILEIIDSVAVLIKAQTGEDGGVLAGHNYHHGAYVRDQFGVARCLNRLGCYNETKAILQRYWDIWQKMGRLHNSHGIGVHSFCHCCENEDVEITGYLIIQTFDYVDKTKDEQFLHQVFPMLEWAWEAQVKHLVKNMLPFNGDETYVAGGILPRSALNDGSAESTLLFVTGGELLLQWIRKNRKWSHERIESASQILQATKSCFRDNFWDGERLVTNNPERAKFAVLPRFRYGVCEADVNYESPWFFGWTEKNINNRYVHPFAVQGQELPAAEPKKFYLNSVSLLPLYYGLELFSKEELRGCVSKVAEIFKSKGFLPSKPEGRIMVGYDYGLLLYNLTELKHPLAADVYRTMLEKLDPTGAWTEYYEDGYPLNTRCRPWESSINLEAAIHYLQLSKKA